MLKKGSSYCFYGKFLVLFGIMTAQCISRKSHPAYCGIEPEFTPTIPPLNTTKDVILKQVIVVIRHGDRTADNPWNAIPGTFASKRNCWPGDNAVYDCQLTDMSIPGLSKKDISLEVSRLYRKIYMEGRNISPGTCMTAQLTSRGYLQQRDGNGKMLRNAYVTKTPFLPKELNAKDLDLFYLRSDDKSRTIQSAESLFLGLYPTQERKNHESLIIDINTEDLVLTNMIENINTCPKVGDLKTEAEASQTYKNFWQNQQNFINQLSSIIGTAMTASTVLKLHDCVMVHLCHDLPIPNGLTDDVLDQLVYVYEWSNAYLGLYPNVTYHTQLGIGFLLQEIFHVMQTSMANTTNFPKFVLFSGHDTTLLPILLAYGLRDIKNTQSVAYASHIVYEIYEEKRGSYYIRFIYNATEYLIPGCDDVLCSFDIFSQLMEELLPIDVETTCASSIDD